MKTTMPSISSAAASVGCTGRGRSGSGGRRGMRSWWRFRRCSAHVGGHGNTSEYIRDLVRRDQQAQAAQRFRDLIAEGLQSGPARAATEEVIDELRRRAFDIG